LKELGPHETFVALHFWTKTALQITDIAYFDIDFFEPERIEKFLDPFPSDKMKAWKISSLVNKPQNDFKEILKPVD
jgi:hypothetical protein